MPGRKADSNIEEPPNSDHVGLLLQLADVGWRDYHHRQSYEWKVNFALWTALGTLTGFVWDKPTPGPARTVAYLVLAGIAAAYIFIWTRGGYRRNWQNYHAALHYWAAAEKIAVGGGPFKEAFASHTWRWHGFVTNWSRATQIGVTLLLLLLAGTALSMNQSAPPNKPMQPTSSTGVVR